MLEYDDEKKTPDRGGEEGEKRSDGNTGKLESRAKTCEERMFR